MSFLNGINYFALFRIPCYLFLNELLSFKAPQNEIVLVLIIPISNRIS